MKKPIINEYQRFDMKRDSFYSSGLKLHLAVLHFRRCIDRELTKILFKLKIIP